MPDTQGALYEVIAPGLNLRDTPGMGGAVVSVLPKGHVVERADAEESGVWWKVRTVVGHLEEEGWLSSRHVMPLDATKPFRFPFLSNLKASYKRLAEFAGPYASRFSADILPELNKTLAEYGINKNAKRFTHFIAQIAHESAHFSRLEENLNYRGDVLWNMFRKYFRDEEEAMSFHRQPERIANRIYSSRMGNGDEASGDGWRYHGRGFIQLTGRENYREIGKRIGIDIEADPDIVASDIGVALKVACAYWDSRNLNALADADDLRGITRRINGGFIGLADRQRLLDRARTIWS